MQALHRAWRPRTSSLLFLSFFTVLSFSLLLLGIVCAQAWTPSLRSVGQVASEQAWTPNYDESKAGNFTLPDPLVFNDGKPVKTAREWRERRRGDSPASGDECLWPHSEATEAYPLQGFRCR